MSFLGKMIDMSEGILKKVSKKVGSFSKFWCFLMVPKHPNLSKEPTLKSILPKKLVFTSFCQNNCL